MKPSIPRGTRDFGPAEMQKRQYIFNILKTNFQLFGYAPIETPTMENLSTLTGKYGDEGDKLIFKVLDSGSFWDSVKETPFGEDYLKKRQQQAELIKIPDVQKTTEQLDESNRLLGYFTATNRMISSKLVNQISEKALRYDLTVPFARYVVMNQHKLTFPFKRYQIQPVWRADKPQKGRYREFYQCDADVIGSNSLINELELIAMMDKSFAELKVPVVLKINNRKVLSGIAEILNASDKIIDITVAIDKLDKIGKDGVLKELEEKGLSEYALERIQPILDFQEKGQIEISKKLKEDLYKSAKQKDLAEKNKIKNELKTLMGNNYMRLTMLKNILATSSIGLKGIEEIEFLLNNLNAIKIKHLKIELDITLARGLNYYTGTIFEAKADAGTFTPSILGGGRYDDLTGVFGLKNLSGIGISFGVDRIYDVMEELNLFPEEVNKISATKLLFICKTNEEQLRCLKWVTLLRASKINSEIHPDINNLKKQYEYAEKNQIPFTATIDEIDNINKYVNIKNTKTRIKQVVQIKELIKILKNKEHKN